MARNYYIIYDNGDNQRIEPSKEKITIEGKSLLLYKAELLEDSDVAEINKKYNEMMNLPKKISLKNKTINWLRKKQLVLKSIPGISKFTLSLLSIYLMAFLIFVLKGDLETSIKIAFISLITTLLLGPIKFFMIDKQYGAIISIAISFGVGFFIADLYFLNIEKLPKSLSLDNIGNVLTVVALIISFVSVIVDLISFYENNIIKQLP